MGAIVKLHPLVAVSITVWLGLTSAVLLKEAASDLDISRIALGVVLGVVVAVNAARFVIWGHVYRHHPVSLTYPLGATIFPLILIVDHVWYDAPVTAAKVAASLLIMAGVTVLSNQSRPGDADDSA